MKKSLIIHDWDDTITNSIETYTAWYPVFADYFGLDHVTKEEILSHWGKTLPMLVQGLWPHLDLEGAKKMVDEFGQTNEFISLDLTPRPFEGVLEALIELNQKHDLGVLSSGKFKSISKSYAKHIHENLFEYHKFVLTEEHTMSHKPDPRVFDATEPYIKEHDYTDILYIGDNLYDYKAAYERPLKFVAVTTGTTTKQQFKDAGVKDSDILNSFSELPKYLELF